MDINTNDNFNNRSEQSTISNLNSTPSQQPSDNLNNNLPQQFNNTENNYNTGISSPPTQPPLNQSKKKNKIIIIIIIMILLILGILSFILFSTNILINKETVNSNSNRNGSITGNSEIIQVSIANDYVIMLDKKGDLYFYGKYDYIIENYEKPKVIASNVKYFDDSGKIIIVDNDNKSSYIGLDINGWGTTKEFEPVTENIKEITSNNFCFFIIDKDDNFVVRAPIDNSNSFKWCALPKEFDGNFSKVASNVKALYNDFGPNNGYLTKDNELYVSNYLNPKYIMVLSDVKEINANTIISSDNTLYSIDSYNDDKIPTAKEIDKNVIETYITHGLYKIYKTSDNKFYSTLNNKTELKYENIKKPYFYNVKKCVYLNTNNKLTLAEETDIKEVNLSTSSMKEIYDFLR